MRRTPIIVLTSVLLLAACGSDSSESGDTAAAESSAEEEAPAENDTGADDAAAGEETAETDTDEPVIEKPEVEFPGEAPTELVRTVIIEGSGDPAEPGDTVIVDYVGVRSLDGVEFDNSYDRGEPFPVTIGSGGVIQGWEDGLDGALAGERVQLDIPADLAYGETARSEVIRENEALTFVIDVRSVIKTPDASEAPDGPGVELSDGEGVENTEFTDLEVGDGPELQEGDTAIIHFSYYRGDNGVLLESSWGAQPLTIQYDQAQLLPGLAEGMEGMRVGGRRAIVIPPEDGFGPEGNPQAGLPAETDIIFVVDLIAAY